MMKLPGRRRSWCRLRRGWSGRDRHRWRPRRGGRRKRRGGRRQQQPANKYLHQSIINNKLINKN